MKLFVRPFALAALLALAACIPGTHPPDTYTDQTGKTTVIQSDGEQCTAACNSDYDRCMEASPAGQNGGLVDTPSGMFGASSNCRSALKECLPGCKSR